MHVEKFTSSSVHQMFYHVERMRGGHYSNESIDTSRTAENYSVHALQGKDAYEDYKARIEPLKEATEKARGKRLRKDAPCAVGVIVTLPEEYKGESVEHQREFFQTAYNGLYRTFGNAIWGEVHMDEKTPHLHFGFIPEKDGQLNAKAIVNRTFLLSFHDDLDKYLRERLPWYHGGLVAEDRADRMKASEHMAMKDYKAVKAETDKAREEEREIRSDIARSKQVAETIRGRTVSPELVEKVEHGKRLKRSELRELVSLASLGADVIREREEVKAGREHNAIEERRIEEKAAELSRSVQQASKELDDREKKLNDREADVAEAFRVNKEAYSKAVKARETLEADRLETARMVRDFGDLLDQQGKALFTGFTEELAERMERGETKHPDYRDDPKTIAHDERGERYERLRGKADKILDQHKEERCKPFSKLRDMLTSFFRKMGLFNKEKERSLADTFTRGR